MIRFLILILALTASRNNFPLSSLTPLCSAFGHSALKSGISKSVPKYEGVIPSRRLVESSRNFRVEISSPPVVPTPLQAQLSLGPESLGAFRIPSNRSLDLSASISRPRYLQALYSPSSSTTLPPPA